MQQTLLPVPCVGKNLTMSFSLISIFDELARYADLPSREAHLNHIMIISWLPSSHRLRGADADPLTLTTDERFRPGFEPSARAETWA
jgi:hypothetical protein